MCVRAEIMSADSVLVVLGVRSPRVASMLLQLHSRDFALARDLAKVSNASSKDVYPSLKPWFGRLVEVVKAGCVNVYRATPTLRSATRQLMEFLEDVARSARGKPTKRKVVEEAAKRFRERFGVDLSPEHVAVLHVFVDQVFKGSSPYIQVDPGKGETLPGVVATILEARYGRRIGVERLAEVLRELELAGIIYVDRRFYKARLDRSLHGGG